MTTDFKKAYSLLDNALDGGLPVIASYLEKRLELPVIIAEADGSICYPENAILSPQTASLLKTISAGQEEDTYYDQNNQVLIYPIKYKTGHAWVIVEHLTAQKVEQGKEITAEAELALKYYFSTQRKNQQDFSESLWEHFFMSASAGIQDMLKLYEHKMNIDNYYFVCVLEVEEMTAALDWNTMRSWFHQSMDRERTEYFTSIIAPVKLITIIRGNPADHYDDIDPDWPGRESFSEAARIIEQKFNISVSIGLGRAYRPSGLLKSYNEACIALAIKHLSGEKHFIQHFSQLGVFTIIFSNDMETVKKYCLQVLGKLIEQDKEFGTDLIDTLRLLLDNACSWTTTANQMYVHVNTVYYRMFKVEKLLEVDFSKFETRLYLLTAIRTWDTLKICGFV